MNANGPNRHSPRSLLKRAIRPRCATRRSTPVIGRGVIAGGHPAGGGDGRGVAHRPASTALLSRSSRGINPAWERSIRDSLGECYRNAARPARGVVPAAARPWCLATNPKCSPACFMMPPRKTPRVCGGGDVCGGQATLGILLPLPPPSPGSSLPPSFISPSQTRSFRSSPRFRRATQMIG